MEKYGKPLLALLFIVLVVEVLLIAPKDIDRSDEDEVDITGTTSPEQIQQSMSGVEVVGTRNERKEWQLWADKAVDFKSAETWALEKVRAVFFAVEGDSFRVTGDRGVVEMKTKNMKVEGNVVTRSSNGYVFKTDVVNYDSGLKVLISPNRMSMKGPRDSQGSGLLVHGDTLEADMNNSLMKVEGNVVGEKTFKGGKHVVIHSEKSLFSGRSHLAKFLGNVRIDVNTMRITGPEADFHYDSERDIISSVVVRGGIKVSDVDKWATSEQLAVHFDKDQFVFRGRPRVVQNNDELSGEEIIFKDGGRRVEVRAARAKVDKESLEKVN